MEMLIMASGGLNSIASSLGHMEGTTYVISEYCQDVLEEILENLKHENKVTRPVRINIANSKVLELDLLPILSASKDNLEAFQAIVKLLVNLSMPIEVILPMHPNMTNADWEQRHTLQDMLLKIKKRFIQEDPMGVILHQMNLQLDSHGSYRMDKDSMESMNDCLVLIRNILHIEENTGTESNSQIVSGMLSNNIGDIVHNMLSREEAETWISAMVQVIRLMFRDQMSQDLVKRAAKLYEKGTLSSVVPQAKAQASPSPSPIPKKTNADKNQADTPSLWRSLTECSASSVKDQATPIFQIPPEENTEATSSGCDSGGDCSSDSEGAPCSHNPLEDSGCDTDYSKPPLESRNDKRPAQDSWLEENLQQGPGEENCQPQPLSRDAATSVCFSDEDKDQRLSETCSSTSSSMDSSPDGSPLMREPTSDEDSLRDSPTGFSLTDSSSDCSGKDSPQCVGVDATEGSDKKKSPTKEYLCRPRERPRGSPDSQASEEDDACSRSSGNSSTFSRSSNKSSSSTGSSETGTSFSSIDSASPSLQEILRDQLCRFAVRFCKHCLSRCILLSQDNLLQRVNDCYVLWCMSYFLPFASLPCISYSDVRYNLSAMVVTYLMYATLNTWESFTMAANDATADSKSNILFRRLYLLIASLRQILSMTRRFMEAKLEDEERESLTHFIKCLCQLEGLRKLYLLLLRKFRPKNESIQYLRALVVSNDELLRIVTSEQAYAIKDIEHFNCVEYVKQLATRQVLLTYNELLQKFKTNTLEENEAAFTLMYHTAIDLKNHKLIYQLSILDTFADLWEQGSDTCISKSSWDFIDHVVTLFAHNCLNNPDEMLEEVAQSTSKKRKHVVSEDTSEDEVSPFKKLLRPSGGLFLPTIHSSSSEDETAEVKHIKDNIKTCIKALSIKGYKPQLRGLQRLLLETCYAKLACPKTEVVEPVVWLNHIQVKSVPLFAFSQADEMAMNDPHFREILQRLGLHSAKDSQHLFPSIPAFWTAEMCYSAAKLLGDITYDKLRFAMTCDGELRPEFLEQQVPSMTYIPIGSEDPEPGNDANDTPSSSRMSNPMALLPKNMWLTVVQHLNAEKEAQT